MRDKDAVVGIEEKIIVALTECGSVMIEQKALVVVVRPLIMHLLILLQQLFVDWIRIHICESVFVMLDTHGNIQIFQQIMIVYWNQ